MWQTARRELAVLRGGWIFKSSSEEASPGFLPWRVEADPLCRASEVTLQFEFWFCSWIACPFSPRAPYWKQYTGVSLFLFFPIWDLCFQNPFPEYSSFLFIFLCLTARQHLCLIGRHWCSSLPWIIIRSQVPDWIRISRTKVQPLEWIGYLVSRRLATRTEVKVAARRRWINGGNRGKGNRSSDREEWDRQRALESERDRHHSLQRVRRILLPSES